MNIIDAEEYNMAMGIPPTQPYFSEESIEYILDNFRNILLGNSYLAQHTFCEEFESKFADYHGSDFAITCNSGTGALEMIFRAIGIEDKEVIVPTNTFAATAFSILAAGGTPIFADVTADMTLDPVDAKRRISSDTAAICTVHIGGLVSSNTSKLVDLCEDNELYLVEDAAHAHGSSFGDDYAGTFGIAGAFSFYSTKVMTTGEGGMILTDNQTIYNQLHDLRSQGKSPQGLVQNYHETFGLNWEMTEVQALMGISQLEMLDEFIERRNEIAAIYDAELEHFDSVQPRVSPSGASENFYKYILYLEDHNRDKIHRELKHEYDIHLAGYVYEIPLHDQPVFSSSAPSSLPMAENLCANHICLPIFYKMDDEDARYVSSSLKDIIESI